MWRRYLLARKILKSLCKILYYFLKKLKVDLPYDPESVPQMIENRNWNTGLHTSVQRILFKIVRKLETTQVSVNRRVAKQNVCMYKQQSIIQPAKRKEACTYTTWITLGNIAPSEICQTEKGKESTSTCNTCLRESNSWKQKLDWCFKGLEKRWKAVSVSWQCFRDGWVMADVATWICILPSNSTVG